MARDLKKVAAQIVRVKNDPIRFERGTTDDPDVLRFVVVTGAAGPSSMAGGPANPFARLKQARATVSEEKPRVASETEVLVSKSWRGMPKCNCSERKVSRMDDNQFCNHVVSVLLQNKEFEYQLYDMFV